jgi:predicted ATP-binding protein involved in virulence
MKNNNIQMKNHSYFYSLELEGIGCFRERQILDLSSDKGIYSPWTIILGDNGTGKTTLLKVIDRMQPIEAEHEEDLMSNPELAFEFILKNTKIDNSNFKLFLKNDSETFLAIKMKEGKANIVGHIKINSFLISYGASRRMSRSPNFTNNSFNRDKFSSLFDESIELINVEEWYLQKFLAFQTSENGIKKQLKDQLEIIKNILIDFLPDVLDLRIKEVKNINEKSVLEVKINKEDWINLRDLSFGYQTTTALLVDIASKMMEQYPESEKPLLEPVIILIDEIDLHLHPKWQRTVIDKFSEHFPNAQFIVTAHSPLIVQAAQDRNANIVVCRKEGNRVVIDNNPESVKGWRIDQILTSDLFEVSSSQSINIENIRDEKINILLKNELSDSDKKRLNFINEKLNSNPVFSNKEAIDAEELIKKAAELLKK